MKDESLSCIDIEEINDKDKLKTQTDGFSHQKSKILNINTIKSFSTKKEPLKLKECEEHNYNLYDKLIFEPIYTQIHKNIKEYTEEIKTGKQLLFPTKTIKKEINQYKYKKTNLILNDYAKDAKDDLTIKNS